MRYIPFKPKLLTTLIILMISSQIFGQSIQVLPGNGKYSSAVAPQGTARYQRQFYLIDSSEMAASGLKAGTAISSISFKLGIASSDTIKGLFRVYLQNTTDTISRHDTAWTLITNLTSNKRSLTGLIPGTWEWQVKTICSSGSSFSPVSVFSLNTDPCQQPTHLGTTAISSTSATLVWNRPGINTDSFKVEYSSVSSENWQIIHTAKNSDTLTGLSPNTTYRWRVTSLCSDVDSKPTAVFSTLPGNSGCAAPNSLSAASITDTSAILSWHSVAPAGTLFQLQYKQSGSAFWSVSMTNDSSFKIIGLTSGTTYDWQVRVLCGDNNYGNYVNGSPINTTGTGICYSPENFYADSLTGSSANLSWDNTGTSYDLRYRNREVISWSTVQSGMTVVHNDSIVIPPVAGKLDVTFKNGTAFTYSSKGVYVAFEFIDSNGTPSISPNIAFATNEAKAFKNAAGEDSAKYTLSYGRISNDSLPLVLTGSSVRPETWLGSSSLRDSVEVVSVYALGYNATPFGNPTGASALIQNHTNSSKSYVVSLRVKSATGTVRVSQDTTVSVHADSVLTVSFKNFSSTIASTDSIIVSVPAQSNENVLNNNKGFYIQQVNSSILAYADNSDAIGGAGMDSTAGLILAKYKLSGCGAINSAQIFLRPEAAGRSLHAVLLNSAHSIVANSANFTPDSSTVNGYHSFYFASPVSLSNGSEFYIGLATDSVKGYAPVGVQWENGVTRDSAFYRANPDGSNLVHHPTPGRLMIRAEIVSAVVTPIVLGNSVLCSNNAATLSVGSVLRRYANEVVDYSSQRSANQFQATQALGTPNVYPGYGFDSNAWTADDESLSRQYIVLKFPDSVAINYVDIFQTYRPGAVDTVSVKNPNTGSYDVIFAKSPNSVRDTQSVVQHIAFAMTAYPVKQIRIAMSAPSTTGSSAIDAVSIGTVDSSATFSSYAWSKSSGGITSAAGSNSTLSTSNAGNYNVTVSNSSGCSSTSLDFKLVKPDRTPPTIITSTGGTAICAGDSIWLRSSKQGGNTWSTGATTDSILVKTAGKYAVSYNDSSGCPSVTSDSTAITLNSLPVVTISGQKGICPGSSTTLTANINKSGNKTYAWSTNETTASITVNTASTFSVKVTDANGCKNTADSVTRMVEAPAPKITGNLTLCPNTTTTLNAGAGFANYNWANGGSTSSISVSDSGKFKVTVTNAFGCAASDSVQVKKYSSPKPSIAGNLSLCGSPSTLNAGGGYAAYSWSTGAKTPSITIRTAGSYFVNVTDVYGCTGSASVSTLKDSLPPSPGVITASSVACTPTGTVTYTIQPIPEATRYVWYMPDSSVTFTGQGTTSVVVTFPSTFTNGYITVAAANGCGESGALRPRTLALNTKTATPGVISGQTSGLCSSTQTYSISAVDGATSYVWVAPANASIVSGQGTTSVTFSFSSKFASGNISVVANNNCGSSDPSLLAVSAKPAIPASISGPTTVCNNQLKVIYSVPAVTGATSYTWTVPSKCTIVSGQGTRTITVNFGSSSGQVTVKASNTCSVSDIQSVYINVAGCLTMMGGTTSDTSTNGNVALLSRPQLRLLPEIVATDGNSSSGGRFQIDWTLGEPCIESISSSQRLYTQGFHQPLLVVHDPSMVNSRFKMFAVPNPVSTKLKISFEGDKQESMTLSINDATGRVVWKKDGVSSKTVTEVDMSVLGAGVYFLNGRNKSGEKNENVKVIKVGL